MSTPLAPVAMQQIAEAAFKAGWKAACLRLADLQEKGGHAEVARLLRVFSEQCDPMQMVEVRKGETGTEALRRAQGKRGDDA